MAEWRSYALRQEEIFMWYVMQVQTGSEERIKSQCLKVMDTGVLELCFIPYYEEKKRYQGAWHTQTRVLFPGYVFLVSERLEDLHRNLRKVIGLTKLIGTGKEIVPLTEAETALLKRLEVDEKPLTISTGIMENQIIEITEGPLRGMESHIQRIDRHRRKAWLEIEMFGRTVAMEAGLEIVRKN